MSCNISVVFEEINPISVSFDDGGNIDVTIVEGGTGGSVFSVFGRVGAVVAESSDYDAIQVDYDNTASGLSATEVQSAIDEILVNIPAIPVTSVNGETGDVVLDADDIDDATTTNKFATQSQLDQIGDNTNNIGINTGNIAQNASDIANLDNTTIKEAFETVSKNLKSNNYTLTYTGDLLTSVSYDIGIGSITKTLNYTGLILTSIVLSGDTPSGINLTKTLSYTGDNLTSVTYS